MLTRPRSRRSVSKQATEELFDWMNAEESDKTTITKTSLRWRVSIRVGRIKSRSQVFRNCSKHLPPNMTFRRFIALVKVVLMVILRRVEHHSLPDLRGRMIAHLHQLAKDFYGSVAFLGVVEPNGRKVLRPDVHTLPIGLLEVVDLEEIAH